MKKDSFFVLFAKRSAKLDRGNELGSEEAERQTIDFKAAED